MNMMNRLFLFVLSSTQGGEGEGSSSSSSSGSTEKITEALRNMVKSPVFYIVIGAIVLLIIGVYLLRRIVKHRPNTVTIIVRKGEIYKIVDQSNPKYFLVPFTDKVGAVISLNEQELSSDKLFINNGPDALYKINFTIKYKVSDPKEFYKYSDRINDLMVAKLNEDLREYADKGNALVLVRDYREHNDEILSLINKAVSEFSVVVSSYKVNMIEPLGRK